MSNHAHIQSLANWLNQQIVGQEHLINRLLIALLADGHLLVEGAPGLAKTKQALTSIDLSPVTSNFNPGRFSII
jgi:MoxR-like ATPase